jgi:hypothetical protein
MFIVYQLLQFRYRPVQPGKPRLVLRHVLLKGLLLPVEPGHHRLVGDVKPAELILEGVDPANCVFPCVHCALILTTSRLKFTGICYSCP